MGLLSLSGLLSRKKMTKISLMSVIGGVVSRRFFRAKRAKWESIRPDCLESVLDLLTAYDVAHAAGRLLKERLRFEKPALTVEQAECRLRALLAQTDQSDASSYEQARLRLLVSKALFCMEGFQLKACRYEAVQREGLALLRGIPAYNDLDGRRFFRAEPFTPEELIGAAHRCLHLLDDGSTHQFIVWLLQKTPKSAPDYMMRLLVTTFGVTDAERFEDIMLQWMIDYRNFKLNETKKQEQWVDTSLSIVNGDTPARLAFGALGKFLKRG
ncbi:MAG TPA: hypothetical protein V6C99_02680 [Oculatellaceae cyanobacterium]|jgi:hypothetical protein